MKIALITGSCGLVGSESVLFFSNKGFEIVGIENNARKFFFGKDGDTSWIKSKLKSSVKKYKHFNVDIRNYNSLEKIFAEKNNKNDKIIKFFIQTICTFQLNQQLHKKLVKKPLPNVYVGTPIILLPMQKLVVRKML